MAMERGKAKAYRREKARLDQGGEEHEDNKENEEKAMGKRAVAREVALAKSNPPHPSPNPHPRPHRR